MGGYVTCVLVHKGTGYPSKRPHGRINFSGALANKIHNKSLANHQVIAAASY